MDQEGGSPGDIFLKQTKTFTGGVPAFDDNEVEFVAEELVDDIFILAIDIEKVREGAKGGEFACA